MLVKYVCIGNKGSTIIRKDGKKYLLYNSQLEELAFNSTWTDDKVLSEKEGLINLPIDTPLGVHLGKSNMLALDFDNDLFDQAVRINEEMSEEYRCKYISKNIGKEGGHFMYLFDNKYPLVQYINNVNGKKLHNLDTLYGNCLLIFSNEANRTKAVITKENELSYMPEAIQYLVMTYYNMKSAPRLDNASIDTTHSSKLSYITERSLEDQDFLQTLLHIITPRDIKASMQDSRKELFPNHPDRLPDSESAHMYIVALSGVFMMDESVSPILHHNIITYINSLFSEPLEDKRIESILDRDIKSEKYKYDKDWRQKSFCITSKDKEPLEIFMTSAKGSINFIVYNHYNHRIDVYNTVAGVIDFLNSVVKRKFTREKITQQCMFVRLIARPDEKFGFNYSNKTFNTYKRNKEQEIFYDPEKYYRSWTETERTTTYNDLHPRFPKITIKCLESSIGDKCHTLFLPFMKRKYLTRDHSPLFFVFFGVPYSFKSAIVNGVFTKLSHQRHKSMGIELLTEKYNDWQTVNDLILLDEVHHLTTFDLKKLIKYINEITGNKIIAGVRRMYQGVDTETYPQEITFMLTTNESVNLTTEARDRRMVVFKSVHRVADALGISNSEIEKSIIKEQPYFAYYLSAKVEPLYGDDYLHNYNWKTEGYDDFQEGAKSIEDKIIKSIDSNNLDSFISNMIEAGSSKGEVVKCIYRQAGRYKVRLFNTREDVAGVTGVFDNLPVKVSVIRKKIQTVPHVSSAMHEYVEGAKTGNKRIDWNIMEHHIPEDILKEKEQQ